MFNKKSNLILWLLFTILLVAVIIIFSTESTKQERSFRKELVKIDTSNVTSILLYPKSTNGKEVRLFLDSGDWKVTGENLQTYSVPKNKVDNLFSQLMVIKPKRVAARSNSKFSEFQVDSAATRVVVNEGKNKVLDLIIGKFAFQQPRSMSTFVRLNNENEVYEVDGFLDMTFNKDVNSFRNETIIKSDKNNWKQLTFNYNNDSSFTLIKIDDNWTVDGIFTDSTKTESTLNSLSRLTNTNFINKNPEAILPQQTSKLIIELSNSETIEVTGYKNDFEYLIHSSQNPENYFDGNLLAEKIFISKESLF